MLGLLVILSLFLSLRLSLSFSSRGHQWIVYVMSFRNMYGYMGLLSIMGSEQFESNPYNPKKIAEVMRVQSIF